MFYATGEISQFQVSNVLECAQSCQNVPTCSVYAYSKSQHRCWLQPSKGVATINSDFSTGFKTLARMYFYNFETLRHKSVAIKFLFKILLVVFASVS